MDWYLSVGQTSKLFNITPETLRHYDRKGILKPIVDENNGYRYYTWKEMEILDLILEGKYLEIPLNDIKKALDKNSAKGQMDLIEYQEKVIEEKIKHLKKLKKNAKEKKQILQEILSFENNYEFETLKINQKSKKILYILVNDIANNKIVQKDPTLRNMYLEEWLQIYRIKNQNELLEVEKYLGIDINSTDNLELTSKNISMTKEYSGKFVEVKFYGSLLKIEEYIKGILNYFYDDVSKIEDKIDITVKYIWNIYNKEESNYFVEISIPV